MNTGPFPKDITICRGEDCGAEIVFLKTKRGKNIPVNVIPTEWEFRGPNAGEIEYLSGEHQPHHATCPNVGDFRNK